MNGSFAPLEAKEVNRRSIFDLVALDVHTLGCTVTPCLQCHGIQSMGLHAKEAWTQSADVVNGVEVSER